MISTPALCPHRQPCGLCTYYNKLCDEVCGTNKTKPKSDNGSDVTFTTTTSNTCKHFATITSVFGETEYICEGTRHKEECTCDGDESKCDFYEYKRKGV